MVRLILLSMHYTLATKLRQIPKLAPISTWKVPLVINFRSPTKIGPRRKRHLLLRSKLLLEKVADGGIALMFSVLLGADVNDGDIVNLKYVYVLFKAFEAFNLIDLR